MITKEQARAAAECAVQIRPRVEALIRSATLRFPHDAQWELEPDRAPRKKAQHIFREATIRNRIPAIPILKINLKLDGRYTVQFTKMDGNPLTIHLPVTVERIITSNGPRFTEIAADLMKIKLHTTPEEREGVSMSHLTQTWILTKKGEILRKDSKGRVWDGTMTSRSLDKEVVAKEFTSIFADTTAGDRKKLQWPVFSTNIDLRLLKAAATQSMTELMLVEEGDSSALAKGSTRLTQYQVPQAASIGISCFAQFMGKWDYADGQGDLSETFVARLFDHYTGGQYNLLGTLAGLGVQGRCAGLKSMNIVMTRQIMTAHIDRYLDGPAVVLVRSEISVQDLTNWVLAFHGQGPWVGRTVVIVEHRFQAEDWKRYVDVYADLNANKAATDVGLPMIFSVMDVNHAPHDVSHGFKLGTQVLNKTVVVDENASRKLIKLAARRYFIEANESFLDEEPKERGLGIDDLAPTYRNFFRPEFQSQVSAYLKSANGAAGSGGGKVRVSVPGMHLAVTVDPSMELFGEKVLGMNDDGAIQCLVPGLKHGQRLTSVKYPSVGLEEQGRFIVVGLEQYIALAQAKLNQDQVEILTSFVKTLLPGWIVIPAYPVLMEMQAGLDFDGDHMEVALASDTSKDFESLNEADVDTVKELKMLEELLMQGIRYFQERIPHVVVRFPAFK